MKPVEQNLIPSPADTAHSFISKSIHLKILTCSLLDFCCLRPDDGWYKGRGRDTLSGVLFSHVHGDQPE
jgi:hypothetical protein